MDRTDTTLRAFFAVQAPAGLGRRLQAALREEPRALEALIDRFHVEAGGKKVVVVPYNVPGCNDYSTYGTGRTPRDLLQIMKDQFDYLYWEGEQGSPKFFAFNLHPFVSGVPYRTKIIEEFIRYAQGFADVWWAKRIEIAEWCLKKGY
jgi:hypothetical protein